MSYPDIFDAAQRNNFEQSLMMTTYELTSWLVAFLGLMTLIVAVVGVVHFILSERKNTRAMARHKNFAELSYKRRASKSGFYATNH